MKVQRTLKTRYLVQRVQDEFGNEKTTFQTTLPIMYNVGERVKKAKASNEANPGKDYK